VVQAYYTYRIRIANSNSVQVQKLDPNDKDLGQPSGRFGYKGKIRTRIQTLHQAARRGELADQEVQELGEKLFTALFNPVLSRDFFVLYEQVVQERALLRLELDVDERELPEVASLPWEFMCVPPGEDYGTVWLGTDPNLIFSRRRANWKVLEPILLKEGECLRIALVVAAPGKLGSVVYDKIWRELQNLAHEQNNRFELLDLVESATPLEIDKVLERGEPHIFHFIGHAELKKENQRDIARIALADETSPDEPNWIGAERFSGLFRRYRPGIVVLQACEGGSLSASEAFVGVASYIVQQNIPVVVAMQYEVSNVTAQRFALEFYKRLAQYDPVDKAAQEGRRRISLAPTGQNERDFATPVIFMRVKDGHLFYPPTFAAKFGLPPEALPSTEPPQSTDQFMKELNKFIQHMPELERGLETIREAFGNHITSPDCDAAYTHLTTICTPVNTFLTLLEKEQSSSLRVRARGIMLKSALSDFVQQKQEVQECIKRFCENHGAKIRGDQPTDSRENIQRSLVALKIGHELVLEKARELNWKLSRP
jgi:hypothetical protein